VNPLEAHPPLALDDILASVVDGRTKGMPEREVALGDVPARGLSLGDLSLPVMSLRSSALEHNVALTADYCRRAGVSLAPTSVTPQHRVMRTGFCRPRKLVVSICLRRASAFCRPACRSAPDRITANSSPP